MEKRTPARGGTLRRGLTAVGAFVLLGRPHFLVGGLLMHLLGTLLARTPGAVDWTVFAWGQAFVTATQWMVHYQNDLHDLAGDVRQARRTPWAGGSGVLAAGWVLPAAARWAVRGLALAAAVAAVGLALAAASPVVTMGICALTFALATMYSTPPWRLQARGWGPETTAAILVGTVPLLGHVAQGGGAASVLWGLAPLAACLYAVLLVLDLSDTEADAAAGKRTPAVRWGQTATRRVAAGALGVAYVLALVLLVGGMSSGPSWAVLLSLPAGAFLAFLLLNPIHRTSWTALQSLGIMTFVLAAGAMTWWAGLSGGAPP